MSAVAKVKTLVSNPGMISAYIRWIGSKAALGRAPYVLVAERVRIGEWISFSEYWSFRDAVPDSERRFVERSLGGSGGTNRVAMDIGANVGIFSCLMAALGASVHAFEPIPSTFCRLKTNIESNGLHDRVQLNCFAAGLKHDLVTFSVEEFASATNAMVNPSHESMSPALNRQSIATVGLDEYCRKFDINQIDLVKLDVEGMEPLVLRGARSLMRGRKIRAFLIEICPVNLSSVGFSLADLYSEFETVEYSPFEIKPDGSLGEKLTLSKAVSMALVNVALVPNV